MFYEHRNNQTIVQAFQVQATITMERNGYKSVFSPGDWFVIIPQKEGEPHFGFIHADEFAKRYQPTEKTCNEWQISSSGPTIRTRSIQL